MLKHSCLIVVPFLTYSFVAWGQAPGGRGGILNVTPAQTAAITQMNADLASASQALADARAALIQASLEAPRTIKAKVDAVKAAELKVAAARADAFQKLQASPNKLNADQVAIFASTGGVRGGAGRGAGGGARTVTFPHATPAQANVLMAMTAYLTAMTRELATARTALTTAVYAEPRNDAGFAAKADASAAA